MLRSFGLPHKSIQAFPILLHLSPVTSSWFNIFWCRKLQPECGPNLMASSLEDLPMWLAVQATHNEPGSSLKEFHDPAVCFLVEHRPTNVFSSSQAILYSLDYLPKPNLWNNKILHSRLLQKLMRSIVMVLLCLHHKMHPKLVSFERSAILPGSYKL
jgi:hypothetical protein